MQMARDAEGMTRIARLTVTGAANDNEARHAAKTIGENNLVKCSWYGGDPYWGRLLAAAGSAGVELDVAKSRVAYGGIAVAKGGVGIPHDGQALAEHMMGDEVRDRSPPRRRQRLGADDRDRSRPRLHQRKFEDVMITAAETARVLVEALPYIRQFAGKSVVVKLGGRRSTGTPTCALAQDVLLLRSVGVRCVLVHGGGPQVDVMLRRVGKEPEFRRRPARHRRGDARDRPHGAGRKINRDLVASTKTT